MNNNDLLNMEIENIILDITNTAEEVTYSDLQAIIMVEVQKIIKLVRGQNENGIL